MTKQYCFKFSLFIQVCELDIIFNFEKAYFIFDEFILGGEIQETSKKSVLKAVNDQDIIQEVCLLFIFRSVQIRHSADIQFKRTVQF